MRSRYCAYVQENENYLLATWHPRTCPAGLSLDQEPRPRWLGLNIKARLDHDADHASVEFVARYKIAGRAYRMHETRRFERIQGRWVYVDGQLKD